MTRYALAIAGLAFASASVAVAEDFKLPKEVTPALRAACETDVRRLCIDEDPNVAEVKRCVADKFFQLGRRCQMELASAGFSR
jgi:hypothetical protein